MAAFAIVFCLMAVAPMAASADIAIKLSATSCAQDDEITAQVYFPKQYNKVSSLDMSLIYDSKKLEVVSMSQGKDLRKARDKQTNGRFTPNMRAIRVRLTGASPEETTMNSAEFFQQ